MRKQRPASVGVLLPPLGGGFGGVFPFLGTLVQRVPRRTFVMALAGHRSGGNQLRARNDAAPIQLFQIQPPETLIKAPALFREGVGFPTLFAWLLGPLLPLGDQLQAIPSRTGESVKHVHEGQAFDVCTIVGEFVGHLDTPEAYSSGKQSFDAKGLLGVHGVCRLMI